MSIEEWPAPGGVREAPHLCHDWRCGEKLLEVRNLLASLLLPQVPKGHSSSELCSRSSSGALSTQHLFLGSRCKAGHGAAIRRGRPGDARGLTGSQHGFLRQQLDLFHARLPIGLLPPDLLQRQRTRRDRRAIQLWNLRRTPSLPNLHELSIMM